MPFRLAALARRSSPFAALPCAALLLVFAAGPGASTLGAQEADAPVGDRLGSVVFLHPDGMGVNHWGAVRMHVVGPDGRLEWDRLPHLAVYTGHMKDRLTGTSHGGATVHAFGTKVVAESYGMDGDRPLLSASGKPMSLLAEAKQAGLAVGMVNTGTITEPGTGAFAASVPRRSMHEEIALRILESGAEVILGGGEKFFLPEGEAGVHSVGVRADGRNLVEEARAAGYTVVRTREELLALPAATTRVLGLFAEYHTFNDEPEATLAAAGLEPYDPAAPTYAEMVAAALEVLERSGRRFFLVAEEEGSDNLPNSNNATGALEAGRRADEAIGVVRRFIARNPETLLVLTSDSDAGGMQVLEGQAADGRASPTSRNGAPLDGVEGEGGRLFLSAPDARGNRHPFAIAWTSYSDVSGGILIRAEGLGAERVRGTMDNTEVYAVMYRTLLGPLPE